jgi:glyoxylase-like metal-dependent hydrolase (beta-lactamase superfamily II)
MIKNIALRLVFSGLLLLNFACSQPETAFKASTLNHLGDSVNYGSYIIYKIGDGIYKINDPGSPEAIKGGLVGTDIYLICGEKKALLIDLGNNYIDGFEKDKIAPRENAKDEFLDIVVGIIGKTPLEVAVTHMHPDHCGMTKAFRKSDVSLWIGMGENLDALQSMHNLESSLYRTFKHGEKKFDLGGGRVVETFLVRGIGATTCRRCTEACGLYNNPFFAL